VKGTLALAVVICALQGHGSARVLSTRDAAGLEAEKRADSYVFTFRPCHGETQPLMFLDFAVERPDAKTREEKDICFVQYEGGGHQQPTTDPRWRYGSTPPGYKAAVPCKPLQPETTYIVNAIIGGGATGGGRVRIDKKGVPKVIGQLCE
jgi:hypothetical protein